MIQRNTLDQRGAYYLLSQMTAFKSRWLVGSSSISRVGSMKRALWVIQVNSELKSSFNSFMLETPFMKFVILYLARETLILHPPENLFVGLFCISGVKDRPARILLAFASAAAAPIALSSSYTCSERATPRQLRKDRQSDDQTSCNNQTQSTP